MKAGGKVYMTQENQVILTLYDYDFKDNTLLKVAPVPVEPRTARSRILLTSSAYSWSLWQTAVMTDVWA